MHIAKIGLYDRAEAVTKDKEHHMIRTTVTVLSALMQAAPALSESHSMGVAEAGASVFNPCQTCHVIADEYGNTLAGKNAKTGTNL